MAKAPKERVPRQNQLISLTCNSFTSSYPLDYLLPQIHKYGNLGRSATIGFVYYFSIHETLTKPQSLVMHPASFPQRTRDLLHRFHNRRSLLTNSLITFCSISGLYASVIPHDGIPLKVYKKRTKIWKTAINISLPPWEHLCFHQSHPYQIFKTMTMKNNSTNSQPFRWLPWKRIY